MTDARDVARFLAAVGYEPTAPEESTLICPLRLQKLLYYCQGWALALLNRPLFTQPIEAWTYGPVNRDVYNLFLGQKSVISPEPAWKDTRGLSEAEKLLIRAVWKEYSGYPPGELIEMTHRERPWREARAGLDPSAPSSRPLSNGTMAEFFRQEACEKTLSHKWLSACDPIAEWRAADEWEKAGKPSINADELFGELLAGAK